MSVCHGDRDGVGLQVGSQAHGQSKGEYGFSVTYFPTYLLSHVRREASSATCFFPSLPISYNQQALAFETSTAPHIRKNFAMSQNHTPNCLL
jgi:hypothetical protein